MIDVFAALTLFLQSGTQSDLCGPIGPITPLQPGYSATYEGRLNGAPYPVVLRNVVAGSDGLRVRYHQGAGAGADEIGMDEGTLLDTIGGVLLPLRVLGSGGQTVQEWRYSRDPGPAIAALAPGQSVRFTVEGPGGRREEHTVTLTGCGVVDVGSETHPVHTFHLQSSGDGPAQNKQVSLSSRTGWWLREENSRTGLVMTAVTLSEP
ncbi:hypothetical protein [Hyphobacterium marinum]|uniref:Uncharacterized protein n=1 Tax=Hyphobacterium marinum TaxID=3116574 RepID=A0ABU7LZ88_9PROT|nr:hypothetical protein [Hyphobacterium sp. Y6023]MEE2566853.1 hypothetical protein [Hyphobacterium sp. Y6023]